MFGKPQWFQRRKYGGWGLSPKTWQGWAYIGVFLVPVIIVSYLPGISQEVRLAVTGVLAGLLIIDVIHIMTQLKHDERERLHEAVAERNALWTMLAVLCGGALLQAWPVDGVPGNVDPVIMVAIASALLAKASTNIYLDRRD